MTRGMKIMEKQLKQKSNKTTIGNQHGLGMLRHVEDIF